MHLAKSPAVRLIHDMNQIFHYRKENVYSFGGPVQSKCSAEI